MAKVKVTKDYKIDNIGYYHINWDTILSIDPGTKMGWSVWNKHLENPIEYGLLDCSNLSLGGKLEKIYDFVTKQLIARPNTLIACEKPHLSKFFRSIETLYGMLGIIATVAWKLKVPCYVFSSKTIKLYWTGDGSASKEDMIAQMQRGSIAPEVSDDNIVDAIALGHFFKNLIAPRLDKK